MGLVVGTVAVALSAMKRNEPFWVGVEAAVVGFWMLVALTGIFRPGGRAFWLGFLVAASISLVVSFGPASDRFERAGALGWSVDSHRPKISWVSYALAKAMLIIEPEAQGHLEVRGTDPRVFVQGSYRIGPGVPPEGIQGFLGGLGDAAYGAVRNSSRSVKVASLSRGYVDMPDYQDAGHLLAALVFGTGLGGMFWLLARLWTGRGAARPGGGVRA